MTMEELIETIARKHAGNMSNRDIMPHREWQQKTDEQQEPHLQFARYVLDLSTSVIMEEIFNSLKQHLDARMLLSKATAGDESARERLSLEIKGRMIRKE